MPGIVTHYAFGTEVYQQLSGVIGASEVESEAFLLGNLGPDPFFFLKIKPKALAPNSIKFRGIAAKMHKDRTDELLCAVHANLVLNDLHDDSARAYGLGFLCHYLLDSAMHPLVYAQQYAICEAEERWLKDKWMPRAVHSTIETEYDEYVLSTKLNKTLEDFPPHREMLRCSRQSLSAISTCISRVLYDAYEIESPRHLFHESVVLFRLAQVAIDSKSIGLRSRFDYLQPLGYSNAYTNSLALRNERRTTTPFANEDHVSWPYEFAANAFISDDFEEIYSSAIQRALDMVLRYAQSDFGMGDCRALTEGRNFLGRG